MEETEQRRDRWREVGTFIRRSTRLRKLVPLKKLRFASESSWTLLSSLDFFGFFPFLVGKLGTCVCRRTLFILELLCAQ